MQREQEKVELGVAYDELPDGVLVAGWDERVDVLNTAGGKLLGIDPTDAIGREFREVLPLVDLAGVDWWHCSDPYGGLATRTGQPERLLELAAGPHAGRQLLVMARYVRESGILVRLVVAFRGTAARERAERERADLVSTVAHEIRSPLTSVKGFSSTLLAKWERFTDRQKLQMLQAINSDADRVTRLLSDLLDVSRIDAGRIVLRRQVVDLAALVERVVSGRIAADDGAARAARVGTTAEGRDCATTADRFAIDIAPDLPELWLDPDKVGQIIGNLVENAVLHGDGMVTVTASSVPAPAPGSPATTTVGSAVLESTDVSGPGVVVTVTDEGHGIGREIRARIFSRFWRGRPGGTGLGLYIVKGLVEAHGGTVEVGDGTHGGAVFRVFLPAGHPPYELA